MAEFRAFTVTLCLAMVAAVPACTASGEAPHTDPPATVSDEGYADVVERLSPSVVTLQTNDGLGSGVVLRQNVVVTNAHVVGKAADLTVVYADGNQSAATVLASDTVTDLAVVRTERGNLPVPTFRSELPRPGEPALAIGSPLGFQNSVTAGVISGLHRDIPGSAARSQSLVDLVQTDAPISPGNSGGGLLDADGYVIGINEAYLPPSTGAVSLGFAIPSATVLDVAEQLLTAGTAVHPYLGVSLRQLTPAIRDQLGLHVDHGVVVTAVDKNGPAAAAGVRPGDVITDFDGTPVRTVEDLQTALRKKKPGDSAKLVVVRNGERRDLTVRVGSR